MMINFVHFTEDFVLKKYFLRFRKFVLENIFCHSKKDSLLKEIGLYG